MAAPSLPVVGTDKPPVARSTAAASMSPFEVRTRQRACSGDPARLSNPSSRVSKRISTPASRAHVTRVSRTSRARSDTGKYLPVSLSSFRGIPRSCSKNARCWVSGHDRSNRRTRTGDSETNRSGSRARGRILQRPPPLMRIFRPPSAVRSTSTTRRPCLAATIDATSPAAPAPATTMGATSAPRRQSRPSPVRDWPRGCPFRSSPDRPRLPPRTDRAGCIDSPRG